MTINAIEAGSSTDLAAWVQAIGSILAILSGFLLVLLQHWQEKRSRVQTLLGLTASVVVRLAGHKGTFELTTLAGEWATICERLSADMRALRDVLFSVDLSPIGHEVIWSSIGSFVAALVHLAETASKSVLTLEALQADSPVPDAIKRRIAARMRFTATRAQEVHNAARHFYGVAGTRRAVTLNMIAVIEEWANELNEELDRDVQSRS